MLVIIDCAEDKAAIERQLFYSASGEVVGEQGPFGSVAIVPGSFADRWRKAACR